MIFIAWYSEMHRTFDSHENEYFCAFWIKFNCSVRIRIFIRMFKKVIILIQMFYRLPAIFILKY